MSEIGKIEVRECETCRWAIEDRPAGVAVVGERQLVCRRFPPTPIAVPTPGNVQILNTFPVVSPDQWCGEWTVKVRGRGPGLRRLGSVDLDGLLL